jgi:lysophospholipase L1-like esterase
MNLLMMMKGKPVWKLVKAPQLHPLVSANELIVNGGFENGFTAGLGTGWSQAGDTYSDETTIVHAGGHSQKIVASVANKGINQNVVPDGNQWFLVEAWANVASGRIKLLHGGYTLSDTAAGWNKYSFMGRGITNRPLLQPAQAGTYYIDDVGTKAVDFGSLFKVLPIGNNAVFDVEITYAVPNVYTVRQAGIIWNLDNPANSQNYALAYLDFGATAIAHVEKCVGGVYQAALATPAVTYGAGKRLRVVKLGNTVYVIYNNVVLWTGEVSDGGIVSNIYGGVFGTDSAIQFANWKKYACPAVTQILCIGDSKTAGTGDDTGHGGYPIRMTDDQATFVEYPTRIATGSWKVADAKAAIDAALAAAVGDPSKVIVGLGTNDCAPATSQSSFESDYLYILDAVHAKWSTATVYCQSVWNHNSDSDSDTIDAYIANCVTARSTFALLGVDERMLIKPQYADLTIADHVHWNPTGHQIIADAIRAKFAD